ncbi:MAG: chromate transporter, partial [Sediminibacterium sp.]|nr:chromate transporter [Sediminibacterium sp.]
PQPNVQNTSQWYTMAQNSTRTGGYVLFAFLDTELVATGLLSRQQLIDAIVVGQFTPGPVLSLVTFIGYLVTKKSIALL